MENKIDVWALVESENNGGGASTEFVKTPVGTTKIRIIDSEPHAIFKHWVKSANGGKGMSVVCLGRGTCPMCKANEEAKAKGLKPIYNLSMAFAMNAITETKDEEGNVQKNIAILEKSKTFFQQLNSIRQTVGELKNFEINIIRKGTQMNDTTYSIIPQYPPTPLENETEWLNNRIDLVDFYSPLSYEDAQTVMSGGQIGQNKAPDFTVDVE